ncbi:uncharacterized protein LOC120627803 isoform X1 [Pararge aegeria]|uniref:Jg27168 protein n=2 Tax=Pararge aegeria TaxID=116150 RepID=A0A8S4SP66_9NEOP|nr:uncharacterized protein LOC120627803 isoform X1 [Pararge aegeria]CAH2268841.1 jg27168 [Pararge aegeria aegeria]
MVGWLVLGINQSETSIISIKVNMSTYSLDAEKFIAEIKKHRELWDVDSKGKPFRNSAKEKAWCAVARVFIQDFDALTKPEQAEVYRKLYNKWRNIRDAYVRNVRSTRVNKSGGYIFMKQLTFLDTRYKPNPNGSNKCDDQSNDPTSDEEDDANNENNSGESDEPSVIEHLKRRRVSKKRKKIEIVNTSSTDTGYVDESRRKNWPTIEIVDPAMSTMTTMPCSEFENPISMSRLNEEVGSEVVSVATFDEDRSFFDSLLPAVREFDMDQKLKFRYEVLRTIKDIRSSDQSQACKPEPTSAYYIE